MFDFLGKSRKSWKREIAAILLAWWLTVGTALFLSHDSTSLVHKVTLFINITPWVLGAVFTVFGLHAVLQTKARKAPGDSDAAGSSSS